MARESSSSGRTAPATAAPRGGPSARPAARWSASAPGAGRRPGGTRGCRRRPRRRWPRRGPGSRRCRSTRRRARTDGSGMHRRGDDERVAGGERALQLAHPERVGEPDRQRAEVVAAAHVRAHRVGHLAPAARLDPVEHEPRPGARARRAPGPRRAAARSAAGRCCPAAASPSVSCPAAVRGRPEPAPGRQPVAGPRHDQRADQRQREQQDRRPAAGPSARSRRRRPGRATPGGEEGASAGGQALQRVAH